MINNLSQLTKRITRLTTRLSLAAIHLLLIGINGWYLLRYTVGDQWGVVRLGSYFAPWLFMSLFPALVIAIAARRRLLSGGLTLTLLFFGFHYGPLFWPQARAAGEDELRVMTFNVHYTNRNVEEIGRMILDEQPDVIAMQETVGDFTTLLVAHLDGKYPYHLQEEGLTLVSRYPLDRQAKLSPSIRLQRATVETPSGFVTLWNIHPTTAVDDFSWQVQHQTLAVVGEAVTHVNKPLILLGDFNTTPDAENYDLIAEHLVDAHATVGRGFGFTFPHFNSRLNLPWYAQPLEQIQPVVRIDHIFVSNHFAPQDTYVLPETFGSDHRPVVATLRFQD